MAPNEPKESVSETTGPREQDPPYHILSKQQKWNLVIFVSLAGSFSPLSSNIYFPALETISKDIGVNATLVALTVTVYMIVQGIAPSLFAAISDTCGRRLTFTISLTIYTAANLALAFTANYPMLMVLRGLQAAGSAATISVSAGVIADIAYPGERGGFMGTNAGLRMCGQAIGPILGGGLNNAWGFRSIFWFLFSLSAIVLCVLLIFLPETQRSIAGNGSIPLSGFQRPLAYMIRAPSAWSEHGGTPEPSKARPKISWKKAFSPLKYILEKDIAALLAWGAVAYTAWSMVTSSTTHMLLYGFPYLAQWQIGLCFLPNGLGCVCGSLSTGWLLDQSFKQVQVRYRRERGIPAEENVLHRSDFPYIEGRLRLMPLFSIGLIISLALYGPSFEFNDLRREFGPNLAAPLILQFIIAFTSTSIFNVNSTVLIDCFPDRPASATALNNLCRCLLGAAGVSAIQPMIGAVRVMKAFLIVTGIVVACTPLVWAQWRWGEKWRKERQKRIAVSGK
ncbi:Sugar and other transporter [Aspergillus sclerotialis]|uniref:Sugar and other transporter n=1 Tax=Aspergillus sclerotialis TaxID=2070753 RepID=A0A3A2ZIU7_9EURO|nr:Sugar and other transporter [Aspergillus sclerotialis]